MLKAVIFDLDNTLIDFMRMKHASVDAAIDGMIRAGLPLKKTNASQKLYDIYGQHGLEDPLIFQRFLKSVMDEVNYKILAAGIVSYRRAQTSVLVPYAMVIPTLIKLREQGLQLAIVSDAPRLKAWMRLVELGIQDFFDIVVTYDDTKKYKPHPAPFEIALKKLRLSPENCLMVGDNAERDIKGAKNLGMKTALASYGTLKPVTVKPHYSLGKVEDLLEVVKKEVA